jgi:TMEM175 potassium channel family protein
VGAAIDHPFQHMVGIPSASLNQWIADGIYVSVALIWLVPDRRIESSLGG